MQGIGEQRQRLLGIKLRALVGSPAHVEPEGIGVGAALIDDGRAWVIIDGAAQRSLGAALAWATRRDASSLGVIVDGGGGVVARRAAGFSMPITVWTAEERDLLPVAADPVDIGPEASARHLDLSALIAEAGADPHVERGVVTGEVRGLEVCRVVDEPTIGHLLDDDGSPLSRFTDDQRDGVLLEVGVGATDREAFQLMHGHLPTVDALANVVSAVSGHRTPGTRQHPLNRMAPERFLRWTAQVEPERLGLASLTPVDPPVDRMSMKHPEPCVGRGIDLDGGEVTVVFSAGVDLDLMAFVADVDVSSLVGSVRTIVALPTKDLVPITCDLAAQLRSPVELVAFDV